MNMNVKEESRRMVKPANANVVDDHNNTCVLLSNMDLYTPDSHEKVIYVFETPTVTPPLALSMLEEGLGKVLVHFREWAGRVGNDASGRPAIFLTDEGVVYIEATADGDLAHALPSFCAPDSAHFISQFLPSTKGVSELLLVQLTRFHCGGLVIGIAWHHHVTDGFGASAFMTAWSKRVRGLTVDPLPVRDRFLLAARTPPRSIFPHTEFQAPIYLPQPEGSEALLSKTFHFSVNVLKQVKQKASATRNGTPLPYTTFESLLAHLWKCISAARGLDEAAITTVFISVNGRNRLHPPLPAEYFGNVVSGATCTATAKQVVDQPLASLIHKAIANMDDHYIRSSIDFIELNLSKFCKKEHLTTTLSCGSNVLVSSWVHFPLYELDFGWGKPLFVSISLNPVDGMVFLIPSHTKDGSIDVVLNLFHSHMLKFEQLCYKI